MAKTYNIPIFDISVDEEGLGLFGLSFVDNPAIQVELHAFKAEQQKVYFSSHEKREVVSPVLIPNQLIIREAMGIPYYMRANEDCIKKIYEKYMLSGNWNNFTYMHENMELDIEGRDVFLADSNYVLQMAQQDFHKITFHFTSEF